MSEGAKSRGFDFGKVAAKASALAGSPFAFLVALAIVATWGLTGPLFHFSDTWQLVINTGTTIATFLLGFLIQYMQNIGGAGQARIMAHLEKQAEAQAAILAHLEGLATVDHAEHGRMLAELVSHVHCAGHTVIESAPPAAPARRPHRRTKAATV